MKRYLSATFLLLFFLPFTAVSAKKYENSCLRTHLKDAIAVNRKRRDYYASISHGRSLIVSNKLIFLEKLTLLYNQIAGIDRKARLYNENGIPILCQDLLPMDSIQSQKRFFQPVEAFHPLSKNQISKLKHLLLQTTKSESFEKLVQHSHALLKELPQDYYCMTKHILESIYTLSNHAPRYIRASLKKGLPSPSKLLKKLIKAQVKLIPTTAQLDQLAAPLQEEGVGIICHDIPHLEFTTP